MKQITITTSPHKADRSQHNSGIITDDIDQKIDGWRNCKLTAFRFIPGNRYPRAEPTREIGTSFQPGLPG